MIVVVSKILLNSPEAVEYLSISRSKFYQWIDTGKIKSIKIDKRRFSSS